MPTRSRSCSMRRSTAARANWWRRRIATAFYYVLDRATGEFISRHAVREADVGRTASTRRAGRSCGRASSRASKGTLVFPNITGAANWYSPSYSPQTKLFYQAAREMGTDLLQGRSRSTNPGSAFTAGGGRAVNGDEAWGAVRALEATTGKAEVGVQAAVAGVDQPAVDGRRPRVRRHRRRQLLRARRRHRQAALGYCSSAPPSAAIPMSFAVDGKQYVAIAAGLRAVRLRAAVVQAFRPACHGGAEAPRYFRSAGSISSSFSKRSRSSLFSMHSYSRSRSFGAEPEDFLLHATAS